MIVDGTKIKNDIVKELRALVAETHTNKKVCFVQFGTDPASTAFIERKKKFAEAIGVATVTINSDATTTQDALHTLGKVIEEAYDGIVVQLPLPEGIETEIVIDSIPTQADIDMLSEDAKARYRNAKTERTAPVAAAVQEILWHHKVVLIGKKVVVIGKGRLVGEPVMMLLDRQGVSYSALDITTPEHERREKIKEADVIISGIGVPHSITPDMVKAGAVLIDAGTSEYSGKLVGDIDPACSEHALLYTPVPGGVGPVTVACLFRNIFLDWEH